MASIIGIEDLSEEQLKSQVARGGKFITYQYCISIVIMTFRQSGNILYIAPGESGRLASIVPTLISFFLGWWGIPWGPIYTIGSIVKNLNGGTDVTHEVMLSMGIADPVVTEQVEYKKIVKAEKSGVLFNRFLALVLDCVVIMTVGYLIFVMHIAPEFYLAFAFSYFLFFEIFASGQTLGKRLLKVKIEKIDSEELPDAVSLLIRTVVKTASCMFPLVFVIPFFNNKQQSLHDLAAKTVVRAA